LPQKSLILLEILPAQFIQAYSECVRTFIVNITILSPTPLINVALLPKKSLMKYQPFQTTLIEGRGDIVCVSRQGNQADTMLLLTTSNFIGP